MRWPTRVPDAYKVALTKVPPPPPPLPIGARHVCHCSKAMPPKKVEGPTGGPGHVPKATPLTSHCLALKKVEGPTGGPRAGGTMKRRGVPALMPLRASSKPARVPAGGEHHIRLCPALAPLSCMPFALDEASVTDQSLSRRARSCGTSSHSHPPVFRVASLTLVHVNLPRSFEAAGAACRDACSCWS